MKLKEFEPTFLTYEDMLEKIREQIFASVRTLVAAMGGTICTRFYHDNYDTVRYTYFEVDDDGHGVELFVDKIYTEGDEIYCTLVDTEDSYEYVWELSDFNATNANYLLGELESIAECLVATEDDVVTEYPED
jgi:hypothetical protein